MKLEENMKQDRINESGNVLFLILIAVALFAALSYAVTQSTRGGGDANSETSLISSAQLTQYPASIRTAVVRMIIAGADVSNLEFNGPPAFANLGSNAVGVFHPQGGGATFSNAPGEMMADGNPGVWVFNMENEIHFLGTSGAVAGTPETGTVELIAFLPNVTQTLCTKVNEELGIAGIPTETGVDMTYDFVNTNGSTPPTICNGGCDDTIGEDVAALDAQPFGCFEQPANTYNYYHVLVER